MYAYRTPRVVFEWRDTRTRGFDMLRTDIAGFVGVAERGPLHRPLKVESWTQFTSLFGAQIAQGYLAYAVEAFFANGGRTCWVVRVADPAHARPASLALRDLRGRPVLELSAANRYQEGSERRGSRSLPAAPSDEQTWDDPGTWAHHVTATLVSAGPRFTLILRLRGGAPEIWRDLSLSPSDPRGRFVEAVLNHPRHGSRLARARCLRPAPLGAVEGLPSPQALNLVNGVGRLSGGQDGLAPAAILSDELGQSRLRLVARGPTSLEHPIAARLVPGEGGRFGLAVTGTGPGERFEHLTLAPPSFDLQDAEGRPALRLLARSPELARLEVVVEGARPGRFQLTVRTLDGRLCERWPRALSANSPGLSMDPADQHYAERVLNDPAAGSFLVAARDMTPGAGGPTPSPEAPNLWNGTGRLGYGPPRLTLADSAGRPALRLAALTSVRPAVHVTRAAGGRFDLSVADEVWSNLSLDPAAERFVERVLNAGAVASRLVRAEALLEQAALDPERARLARWAADRTYALDALNDPHTGSQLVAATGCGFALPTLDLADATGRPALRLTALRHPRGVAVEVGTPAPGGRFDLTLRPPGGEPERFGGLSMDPADSSFVERVLGDPATGSGLVSARALRGSPPAAGAAAVWREPAALADQRHELAGGLTAAYFDTDATPHSPPYGLAALAPIDEVSIIASPDLMPKPWAVAGRAEDEAPPCGDLKAAPGPPTLLETPEHPPRLQDHALTGLQLGLIAHCETLRDRIALIDPPVALNSPDQILAWRNAHLSTGTTYAALYYPWVMVSDPLRLTGLLRAVPPSGHVAGVYARVDLRDGVHRPPANELLMGVLDIAPNYRDRLRPPPALRRGRLTAGAEILGALDDAAHGLLNEHEINVIRPYPGRGVRVMGERILEHDGAIRYVNVRRLLMMIAETIDERTQWTVFEPSSPLLWLDIERVVASFLTTLWQRGMLDGATREEAFLVRCDASTNPPEETALGRVICHVGVQPPWPAEFVIVRIGKTESGVTVLDGDRI